MYTIDFFRAIRSGALLLALPVLLAACSDQADMVDLATLVDRQADYHGQRIETQGTVATFEEPRHYWIEDDSFNRVAIEPDSAVEEMVGADVRVIGEFTADRATGRILYADEVIPVSDD